MISPRMAFAAFDFGTTAAKAAVVLPDGSFRVLRSISTKVRLKAAGGATCRASEVLATCRSLLEDVARLVAQQNVATLHLGLCAHVSSLILWSPKRKDLENDDFPICTPEDTICLDSLNEASRLLDDLVLSLPLPSRFDR